MKRLTQSIEIAADPRTIWECIVDPLKYEAWTAVFQEGSRFEGGWEAGDAIRFYAENPEGSVDGMVSEIAESRCPEFISIRHLGLLRGGAVDRDSEEARVWTPAYENYQLETVAEGLTRFTVDMEVPEAFEESFGALWSKGLQHLKRVSEESFGKPMRITVRTRVAKPMAAVWEAFTKPEHITGWNHASPDWHCPNAENDPVPGGRYAYTMAARDGSVSFVFSGVYTKVVLHERVESVLDDGRQLSVTFRSTPEGVAVEETFEAEGMNSLALQRQGWQAILNNFARYVEARF